MDLMQEHMPAYNVRIYNIDMKCTHKFRFLVIFLLLTFKGLPIFVHFTSTYENYYPQLCRKFYFINGKCAE